MPSWGFGVPWSQSPLANREGPTAFGVSMSVWLAVLLGVVQGLTEFLPVSSSGHLVLLQQAFGLHEPQLLFDVVVHVATLLAVLVVFWRDVVGIVVDFVRGLPMVGSAEGRARLLAERPGFFVACWIVLTTAVTGAIGFGLQDTFKALFSSITAVGIALLITGGLLMATRFVPPPAKDAPDEARLGWWRALLLGLAQAAAITPGISRSGTTIVVGLYLGLSREAAARFSFLVAIPAILGALVLEGRHVTLAEVDWMPMLAGFIAAALVGWLALKLLLWLVEGGRLHWFAIYVWGLGAVAIGWGVLR